MKIVTIKNLFFHLFPNKGLDYELMSNSNRSGKKRPFLIIVHLKYKNIKRDFAIPFRSNIQTNLQGNQYFSLPTRKTTKDNRKHALHYAKIFPVHKKYFDKFNYPQDEKEYYEIVNEIIKKIYPL
jgi:hypothetical protein